MTLTSTNSKSRRWWLLLPPLSLAFLVCGCNGTFYQPDHVDYADPAQAKLAFTDVAIPTADGLVLHGWHVQPRHQSRGLILHFHGNAQNMSAHFSFVEWLADDGFEILTFDYRGYGKSPGVPSRDGLLIDGQAAITFAKAVATRSNKALFILAQSLGGAVAIPALEATGTQGVSAVVVESSFGSYRDLARFKMGQLWLTWALQWPLSYLVTDNHSAADSIGRLDAPLLVIHGDKDDVVPLAEGKKMYAAASADQKEFWTVKDGGHTSAFAEGSPFRARLVSFLDKHAKNSPGANVQPH